MKIEDINITDLCRVTMKPSDLLVLKVDGNLSMNDAAALREYVQAQAPGHNVLVLDRGLSLAIVGEE